MRLYTAGAACLLILMAVCETVPARPQSSSEVSPPQREANAAHSSAIAGSLQEGNYRNPFFDFSCRIPYGWVNRTQEMGEDASDTPQGQVLLAVFERPPEAIGETINSAVVITAESASSYRGLKTAADYFGPITEVATAKGFKVINEPYAVSIGAKRLVRGDFSKEKGKLTMYQSSLVALERGYLVTFTFIAGSQDEIEELSGNLKFTARAATKQNLRK